MWRVLKISAVLMGIVLIAMTVGLWITERTWPTDMMVVKETHNDFDRLILLNPDTGETKPLTPEYNWIVWMGWGFDGSAVFFAIDSRPGYGIYRALPDDGTIIRLTNTTTERGFLTPDGRWIVFREGLGNPNYRDIAAIRLDGIKTINLMHVDPFSPLVYFAAGGIHPSDSQTVYFIADLQYTDLYRVGLDGRNLQNLTVDVDESLGPIRWLDDRWLLLENAMRDLVVISADGREFHWVTSFQNSNFYANIVDYFPQTHRLYLITYARDSFESHLIAINTMDWQQAWSIALGEPNAPANVYLSPNHKWLLFKHYAFPNLVGAMRTDGQQQRVLRVPDSRFIINLSPNGEWMLFVGYDATIGGNGLWRAKWDGAHITRIGETMFDPAHTVVVDTLSPDGEWLILRQTGNSTDNRDEIFRIRQDGTALQRLFTSDQNIHRSIVAWQPKSTRRWNPMIMGSISVGLLLFANSLVLLSFFRRVRRV
ncbi:MAG: hypothetical protein K8L91_31475 [Anaerolineae bacterium]|nr:hypothetical protein [Anaerolineae bacterium]